MFAIIKIKGDFMKVIVAVEGQGYEADINAIEIFPNLTSALMNYMKDYTEIYDNKTINANADLHKLNIYKAKLAKNNKLIFEREGGFWLEIREKEIVC